MSFFARYCFFLPFISSAPSFLPSCFPLGLPFDIRARLARHKVGEARIRSGEDREHHALALPAPPPPHPVCQDAFQRHGSNWKNITHNPYHKCMCIKRTCRSTVYWEYTCNAIPPLKRDKIGTFGSRLFGYHPKYSFFKHSCIWKRNVFGVGVKWAEKRSRILVREIASIDVIFMTHQLRAQCLGTKLLNLAWRLEKEKSLISIPKQPRGSTFFCPTTNLTYVSLEHTAYSY